ncbi:hypothetical protein [Saccharothrix sp. ALI-22-I]|uniref:beta-xylosidase family glycoside hydrolase n=1 Tax=Saccharothrix sp. ALI-22-I TaxID=1933778 RepID=UPI001EE7025A|nr:hypothetical protein [Saccharothrix sp. ALI-22-I]
MTTRASDSTPPADDTTALTGPDVLAFSLDADEPVLLAELDGRYLSTEVAAGFTGRVIGMYVTEGTASFDWFDYQEITAPA